MRQVCVKSTKETSLFKPRSFLFLWMAGLFSGLSISIVMFAQAWYIVQVLNMEASLGLVYIAIAIARLIFMAVGGVLADRMSRSVIMFLSDLTRALLLVGLVITLLSGQVSLPAFVGFAFILGVLDAFFWPSENSLIPSVVQESQLTRANSIVQMTNQMTAIAGPLIAGFIIAWGNFSIVFGMTAVLLFIGGILIYFVKTKPVDLGDSNVEKGMFESIKEGLNYSRQSPVLLAFILKTLFLNLFFTGPVVVGLPIFVKKILKGGTLDYSYLEGSLAIGMVTGSFLVAIINLRVKRGPISLASQGLMALFLLLLSQTVSLWQSLIAGLLLGVFMMISNISAVSAIQHFAKKDKIGRVMSLQTMASIGLTPISYGLTSLALSVGVSIDWIMLTGAIFLILCTASLYWKLPAIRSID